MKEYGLVKSWTKLSIDNCVGFIFDPTLVAMWCNILLHNKFSFFLGFGMCI